MAEVQGVGHHGAMQRRRRAIALVWVVVTMLLVAVGCSRGGGGSAIVAVGLSTTTTTGVLPLDEGPPPTRPPMAPAQIEAGLTAAIEARDFCAFYGVVDDAAPDMADHSAVTEAYGALAKAAGPATAIVPSELADDWSVVARSISAGSAAVRAAKGDVGDPSVRLAFSTDEVVNAQSVIERWIGEHCPTPK